jgi:hypothetical protein
MHLLADSLDLLAFAAGPWARAPEAGDPRLRPHFVYRQDVENARKSLVHHAAWLAQMERVFGPYRRARSRLRWAARGTLHPGRS